MFVAGQKNPVFLGISISCNRHAPFMDAKKQTAYERCKKSKNTDLVLLFGPLSFFVSRS